MACRHKIPPDHSFERADGTLVWICSHCETRGPWATAWAYFGNIECTAGGGYTRGCGWPQMDWVACSAPCADALGQAAA